MQNPKEILDAKIEIDIIGKRLAAMRRAENEAVDIRGEIEDIRRKRDIAESDYRESILKILDGLIKQQQEALVRLKENIKATEDSLARLKEEEKERRNNLPKIDTNRGELNTEIEKLNLIISDLEAKRTDLQKDIEQLKVTCEEYDLKTETSINKYIKCLSKTQETQESLQPSM